MNKRIQRLIKDVETACPVCDDGEVVNDKQCRNCGAEKQISQVSGNVVWSIRGRMKLAFEDEKAQWIKMAERYGISEEDYPEKFKLI